MNNLKLPYWFRQDLKDFLEAKKKIKDLREFRINTVCESALCPNIARCFKENLFTFMILGDACTRRCSFCAIKKMHKEDLKLDYSEPLRIAKVVNLLKLDYVVITSVTRDDLSDGGVNIFVRTVEAIREISPETLIELLIPDFGGNFESLEKLVKVNPKIIGHNLETVPRIYREIRPKASYKRSLEILKRIKELRPEIYIKSALLLGLGEEKDEIIEVMEDLIKVRCDILVLGQYLSPSKGNFPVKRFLSLEEFQELRQIGLSLGFRVVSSGPEVRSSYQARQIYKELDVSRYYTLYRP